MQNIVSNALNYFLSLFFLSTQQAENQNISKCIRSCLRVLQCFSENVYLNIDIIYLQLHNAVFQRKIYSIKMNHLSAKILWKIIFRKINIPHSVNEDEEVYVVILDISTVKVRQSNQTFILFK